MENASKALLMAAGILVGILILTLMVTLFLSSREINTTYEQKKKSEAVQQFNVNFTKYIGQELTIHQVVTITNFAKENNVTVVGAKLSSEIKDNKEKKYKLEIVNYTEEGYIIIIKFTGTN